MTAKARKDRFLNEHEVMVNALQRSGHHAFVEWLCLNIPRHLFVNCVTDARIIRPRYIRAKPEDRFKNDLDLDIQANDYGRSTHKSLLMYNTESFPTEEALKIFDDPKKMRRIGPSWNRLYVIWIRDPFNNLASQFQRSLGAKPSPEPQSENYEAAVNALRMARDIWCDHWQAFKTLPGEREDVIGMIYNDWLDSEQTRSEFLSHFDRTEEARVDYTVPWGNGSSFADYQPEQAAPDKGSVETRYLQHLDHPEYRALFEHELFRELIEDFLTHYSSDALAHAADNLIR